MHLVLTSFFKTFSLLVAGGGSPGDCDFSAGGDVCSKTCDDRKPNIDPSRDPDYREFKDLYSCIESKCVVQLGACEEDEDCNKCCKYYDFYGWDHSDSPTV